MKLIKTCLGLLCFLAISIIGLDAQMDSRIQIRGVLQSEAHYATKADVEHPLRNNSYLNLFAFTKKLSAGLRAEYMRHPLPGFEANTGWGISNIYLAGSWDWGQVTLGDIYEQFGSGSLLRSYEDRALGIDNSIRGLSLNITPMTGLRLKALGGEQRNHFDRGLLGLKWPGRSYVLGSDLTLQPSQWLKTLSEAEWETELGFSFVSRIQSDQSDVHLIQLRDEQGRLLRLVAPSVVPAWSARLSAQRGGLELTGEFGYKFADPIRGNNYIFRSGSLAMLTASYSTKGVSLLLGARRSENFDFRSHRSASLLNLKINHLVPFTTQQSYALAALRPYATQPMGEWALQGELHITLPRGSSLGGRYGTRIKLTASHINGLKAIEHAELSGLSVLRGDTSLERVYGSDGTRYSFFGMGPKYFHDYGVEISRKFSSSYQAVLSYFNQGYNEEIIEGHPGHSDLIRSHILTYEGKHRLSHKMGLRTELQYLYEASATHLTPLERETGRGDWLYGSVEWSLGSKWLFSISDQWNVGGSKMHYYLLSTAFSHQTHRIQLSWGKTRAGINCSGGVCRFVPETSGFNLSLTTSF